MVGAAAVVGEPTVGAADAPPLAAVGRCAVVGTGAFGGAGVVAGGAGDEHATSAGATRGRGLSAAATPPDDVNRQPSTQQREPTGVKNPTLEYVHAEPAGCR